MTHCGELIAYLFAFSSCRLLIRDQFWEARLGTIYSWPAATGEMECCWLPKLDI